MTKEWSSEFDGIGTQDINGFSGGINHGSDSVLTDGWDDL